MVKIFLAALFCAIALSGCISMPESPREILEGKQEQKMLQGVEISDISIAHPISKTRKIENLKDFYADLKFNPYGQSLYMVALKDPNGARHARNVKNETVALIEKLFPDLEAVDDNADAFRHIYFSFRLSQRIGTVRTKKFTDAYEISNINKIGGRCMDLWNNRIGRDMFEEVKLKLSPDDVQKQIFEKIEKGDAMTTPFELVL